MKAPRIIGLDLANAIALPGLFLSSFALVLTDQYTKLSGSEFDLIRDIWACVFVFVSGMIATVMMRNSHRRSLRQKKYFLRKGFVFLLLGIILTVVWPVNILVLLGVCFMLTPWVALLNSSILRFLCGAIFLAALLFTFLMPNAAIPHSTRVFAEDHISIVNFWNYLVFSGRYGLLPYVGFYLAGMTYARSNFLDKRIFRLNNTLGLIGVAAAVALHFIWTALFPHDISNLAIDDLPFIDTILFDLPPFVILGCAIPILLVNCMIWLSSNYKGNAVVAAFAKLGAIKHSAYINHLIVGGFFLWAFNQNFFNNAAAVLALTGLVFMGNFVFAQLWKKRHNLGPVEWFINRLSGSHDNN